MPLQAQEQDEIILQLQKVQKEVAETALLTQE